MVSGAIVIAVCCVIIAAMLHSGIWFLVDAADPCDGFWPRLISGTIGMVLCCIGMAAVVVVWVVVL